MPALNYAVRLRASYEALATTCSDWATRSEKMLCYEHPDDPKNLHCHFLLVGVRDSTDTLKRDFKSHGLDLKGPGQVSFKTSYKLRDGTKVDITEETIPKYITYMSKGIYDPKYNKGYEPAFIELCKKAWVTHTKQSREEVLLSDFNEYIWDYKKKFSLEEVRLAEVRSLSIRYAIVKAKGIINVGTRKDAKMLFDSYAYSHDMITPLQLTLPFEK